MPCRQSRILLALKDRAALFAERRLLLAQNRIARPSPSWQATCTSPDPRGQGSGPKLRSERALGITRRPSAPLVHHGRASPRHQALASVGQAASSEQRAWLAWMRPPPPFLVAERGGAIFRPSYPHRRRRGSQHPAELAPWSVASQRTRDQDAGESRMNERSRPGRRRIRQRKSHAPRQTAAPAEDSGQSCGALLPAASRLIAWR